MPVSRDPAMDRTVEWGVEYERHGRRHVTVCESEEAARALQAASRGGEVVTRVTYSCDW